MSLEGKYSLEKCVAAEGETAFFTTVFGPARHPALLKLIPEDAPSAGRQLERWRRAARLFHPNLLALLDCGRVDAPAPSAGGFLYAVFEYPDDSLATALASRPLTAGGAAAIHRAVSDALRYIHSQNLVHGAVDAGHIVAVGDLVKLASDTIREPAPEASAADDLRALDGLLGPPEPAPLHPPPALLPALEPVPPPAAPPPSGTPRWTYAGLAAPVVALIAVLLTRSPVPRDPEPVPISTPAPLPAVPAPSAPPKPAGTLAAAPESHGAWRVVAYTYGAFRDADHKVRRINEKWPAFRAEVFTPKGRRQGPYYVALGGRMARLDAERLQRTARAAGLPRDTFVRNFSN
jgi:hypothetical protein